MGKKPTSLMCLAVLGLCLLLETAARPASAALTIDMLQTNKGCGASATFVPGEGIQFFMRVSQTATATLTLIEGGQPFIVFQNQTLLGGVNYFVTAVIGSNTGPRTLDLTAAASGMNAEMTCDYSVSSGPSPPLAITTFQTNKGTGAAAMFVPGEIVRVFLSVSQTASASMTVQKGGQAPQPVFTNVTLLGGVLYFVDLVAGSDAGQRILDLTASAGGMAVERMADFTVTSTPPTPVLISMLQTNKGCDTSAVFRPGELIQVFVSVTQTVNATLMVQRDSQPPAVVFANQTLVPGVLYEVDGIAGSIMGPRTLQFSVTTGSASEMKTCAYSVTTM
jgi:hypothetical protein